MTTSDDLTFVFVLRANFPRTRKHEGASEKRRIIVLAWLESFVSFEDISGCCCSHSECLSTFSEESLYVESDVSTLIIIRRPFPGG